MPLGLLDLSIVTDRLIDLLKLYRDASRLWEENRSAPPDFTVEVTGLAPDAARAVGGCQLSVYLFHVAVEKSLRNTYPTGGSAQRIPEQPLALSLYFLVTAWSDSEASAYVQEQQAMSIALKFFHETTRMVATVPLGQREQTLTVTFEPQGPDEIGRLWQALASPLRLSAVYRAAVAILEPPEPEPPDLVQSYNLQVVPSPILSTVAAPGGAARIAIRNAGFDPDEAQAQLGNRILTATTGAPGPGQFRVVDTETLDLRVPAGTGPRGYLLLLRPAADTSTVAIWLVVS
jgi:hypothetical protein